MIPNEYESLAENLLDDLVDECAEDEGDGPLEPRLALIEIAGRAIARAVLEHQLDPEAAIRFANGRASRVMLDAIEEQPD
jgi:hypothetical protein